MYSFNNKLKNSIYLYKEYDTKNIGDWWNWISW